MKIMGAIFFLLASSFIGFDLSRQLSLRSEQLRALIYSLQMIEAEMTYSYLSLHDIFNNVYRHLTGPVAMFYKYLANNLERPVTDFFLLWTDAVERLKHQSALKKQEINILHQFGTNIGNHTVAQQMKQIKLTIYYLQQQLDEALEKENKYDKTIKSLGFLFGLLIVLILI